MHSSLLLQVAFQRHEAGENREDHLRNAVHNIFRQGVHLGAGLATAADGVLGVGEFGLQRERSDWKEKSEKSNDSDREQDCKSIIKSTIGQ